MSAPGNLSEQLYSVTRALSDVSQVERLDQDQHTFLSCYAELLDAAAAGARVLGSLHTYADLREQHELDDHIEQGRRAHHCLDEQVSVYNLDQHSRWPAYEALHLDGHRLVEELAQADHDLAQLGSAAEKSGGATRR